MLENFTKEGTQEITRKKECLFGKRETLSSIHLKSKAMHTLQAHTHTHFTRTHTHAHGVGDGGRKGKEEGGKNPVPYEPFTHDFKQLTLFFGALF